VSYEGDIVWEGGKVADVLMSRPVGAGTRWFENGFIWEVVTSSGKAPVREVIIPDSGVDLRLE
jgi:hypothetical protein